MDMLDGQMPIVADKIHRVIHVGSAEQKLDFTTISEDPLLSAHGIQSQK